MYPITYRYPQNGIGAFGPPTSTGYATIMYMQEALNYLGYTDNAGNPLTVDDSMGQGGPSMQALKKFQQDQHLIVDGQYGSQSWTALQAAVAAKQAPGPNPPDPNPPGPNPPGPNPPGPNPPGPLTCPPGQVPNANGTACLPASSGGGGGGAVTPAAASGGNTTLYLVGGLAVVGLLGAYFLMTKKKR